MTPLAAAAVRGSIADERIAAGPRVCSPLLVPLPEAFDMQTAGGKGATLARMIAFGAPVPAGVVLTCEAFDIVFRASALIDRIERRLSTSDRNDFGSLQAASRDISALVLETPMPQKVDEAIGEIAASLAGPVWVVRSSAVGEDGERTSFAGQFDSILHVQTVEQLRSAVRRCWASYWSARALFYRQQRAAVPAGMAIVVQRQVDARIAGVLFTRNPANDRHPAALVIEHVSGLADRLVSGETTPRRIYVSRRDRSCLEEVGGDDDETSRLAPGQVRQLVDTALHLESVFGRPQDVEWAIGGDGRLAIVQSRPITTVPYDDRRSTRDAIPVGPTVLWSNANVSENFPEPVSPLLYSIACAGYRHYFHNLGVAFGLSRQRLEAMAPALRTIVGAHGARLYYNLTHIHAVLRMAPFGDRLADAFNLFVGADEMAAQPADVRRWEEHSRLRQTLELIRIAASVLWQFLWLPARLRRFERLAGMFAARTTEEALASHSLARLGTTFMDFVEIRRHRWKNASLCDTAAMVCYAALRRALARQRFGDATHTKLLRALPGVPSSQPALRLWDLSRLVRRDPDLRALFQSASSAVVLETLSPTGSPTTPLPSGHAFAAFARELDRYLSEWGFRSSGELMLTSPTLQECPEPVIDLIRTYAASDGNGPADTINRQAGERRADTRAVLLAITRRAPLRAGVIWLLLRCTQGAIACRERARLAQALLYTRCRRVALHIGEALVRDGRVAGRDDVFMLTWQEVEELCAGRAMFPHGIAALVELRRSQHAAASHTTPPDTIRLAESAGWQADGRQAATDPHDRAGNPTLTGAIACGGRVTARAAVLSGVDEAHKLTAGDVLVTRQTDPGWAPVFCLVSGLVIERGGMLSHGAIIAREFGLPCLVNVKDATTSIPHGTRLTLDADAGECRLEASC